MKISKLKRLRLAACLSLVACISHSEDFLYTTNNIEITITGYTGAGGDVVIPSTINSLEVTAIGPNAFASDNNLTSITIPSSVRSIGWRAFISCRSVTNATISDGVLSIDKEAFNGCDGLTSIYVPQSAISVEGGAFGECDGLIEIIVDELNPIYSSQNGVFFDKNKTVLIQYPAGKSGRYTVPESVNIIKSFAFMRCHTVTEVIIPEDVTLIEQSAFADCASITSMEVDNLNPSYCSVDGILFNKDQSALIFFPAGNGLLSYDIPDGVNIIEKWAFGRCSSLVEVILPEGLTSIRSRAFDGCRNLANMTIPSSVVNIGGIAFQSAGLEGVYFMGDAPIVGFDLLAGGATVYYLQGAAGWNETLGGRPTALWDPSIQTTNETFGIISNSFSFNISGPTNALVKIESTTNLVDGIWESAGTYSFVNGLAEFADPSWTNSLHCYYRLSMPD